MEDDRSPACWTWPATEEDIATAQRCPENLAHVALWNWQQGRCACCGKDAGGYWKLVRDHDHATGFLRGLLCTACNVMEGQAARYDALGLIPARWPGGTPRVWWRGALREMSPIEAMAGYREKNPAILLGVKARHSATSLPKLPPEFDQPLPIERAS